MPVIGIGAGPDTDGQILVLYDVLDITAGRKPKFSKNFLTGHDSALEAVKAYAEAVKARPIRPLNIVSEAQKVLPCK